MKLFFALGMLLLGSGSADDALIEDFESPVFDGWERVNSNAHPPYNSIDLVPDAASAKSGKQFLRMVTQGGSTALRRRPWAVDASRPCRLTLFARLTGTRRNAAVATLIWLNADGDRISESRSAPMTRAGGWTEVAIEVARVPAAATAVSARLDFEGDDVRGQCDFDRLVFSPVERLDVQPAGKPHAVFSPDEYPRFALSLAGAPAGIYGITCVLKSADGPEERRSAILQVPSERETTVDFRASKPGAYELEASVDGRDARRSLTVLVANPWDREAAIPPLLLQAAVRGELHDAEGRPTRWWLARQTLNELLDGAAPMPDPGLFPPAVRVAAFRKPGSALLALWCETGEIEVPVSLNEGAKLRPTLGSPRPLKPGEKLRVGPMPVFITGIDPLLLDLKIALAGGDLPLQLNPSTRTFRLHNPYRSQALREVRVRLEEIPAGWRVSPRSFSAATLAADGDLAEELQFALPASESDREQELKFEIAFVRNGQEQVVRLSRVVRLSSPIRIEARVSEGPRPETRTITIRVSNASERAMTLALRARLPQLPEQIELLRDLAPGATSAAFEYVVKDIHLIDPTRLRAEIEVQESVGARAGARRILPIR